MIPPVPSLFTLFSHTILPNQGLPGQRRCRSRRVPRRLFRPGCRARRPAARHGRLLGKACLQPHAAMRGGRLRSRPARLARCRRGQGDGAGGSAHVRVLPALGLGSSKTLFCKTNVEFLIFLKKARQGWDNRTALGYFRSDWRQSACADWAPGRLPSGKCEPRPPSEQPVWIAFKGALPGATPFGLAAHLMQ